MKRYKATLFKSEKSKLNPTSSWRTTPIDTVLLEKKCHATAENLFFNKRGWKKAEHYHIEIENLPRFLA
jgi:hypothetical protein